MKELFRIFAHRCADAAGSVWAFALAVLVIVRGALGLKYTISRAEQDFLNPRGINCIRNMGDRGIRVWGARTVSSDPSWRYINVRRLFLMVEQSIEIGTQWVVFEPNDSDLWARVRRDVGGFLTGVWRSGALFGLTPEQAFFVKCDEELNPPDVRDRGQLIIGPEGRGKQEQEEGKQTRSIHTGTDTPPGLT